ncbi:MAG TPA: hypothetical protein GX711_10200, partial [Clostridia bacterium]|nr:hypothetical protein [Clostridia bacterium]
FVKNVPPEQINSFVRKLPEEKRKSLYSVAKELSDHGLIQIRPGEFSTIDEDTDDYQK